MSSYFKKSATTKKSPPTTFEEIKSWGEMCDVCGHNNGKDIFRFIFPYAPTGRIVVRHHKNCNPMIVVQTFFK